MLSEAQMTANNTSAIILIRENTLLPTALAIETGIFLPGWRAVRNLDGSQLGRKIEEAKWNFFYLAGDLKAIAFGRERPATLCKAVKNVLARQGGREFNSLEITKVASERFLGIPYVRVTAHYRHIQEGIGLGPVQDAVWRISAAPNGGGLAQQHTALISSF
jgi:hypothetical protein